MASSSNTITFPRPFLPFSIKRRPLRPYRSPVIPRSTTLSVSQPAPHLATVHFQTPLNPILTCGQGPKEQIFKWRQDLHEDGCGSTSGAPSECAFLLRAAIRQRDLQLGRVVHAYVVKNCSGEDETCLSNMVMNLYLKVGRNLDARKVFDEMPLPDVVSYSSLIASYAKCGSEEEAVGLFFQMRRFGVEPNEYTFVAVLSACTVGLKFELGLELHALAVKTNFCSDVYVGNALMALFIKDDRLDNALRIFDQMRDRDVASWNTVMTGLVKESRYSEVLLLFQDMRMDGIGGDRFTLSSLLTAAEKGCFPKEGRGFHAHSVKIGLDLDLSVGNALISFYNDFGRVEDAVDVFERMPIRDVVSWTAMVNCFMAFGKIENAMEIFNQMPERNSITYNSLLAGFCHNGNAVKAIEIFQDMVEAGLELSDFTLSSAVNACALTAGLEKSRQVHAFVLKVGCESNPWIEAALLDMCIKCNRMEDGLKMLNRWPHEESYLIACTSMLCGYVRNGYHSQALSLFLEVIAEESMMSMDEVALATFFGICGTLGFISIGKQIHCHSIKSGHVFDVSVGNAIFSMYSKCGSMDEALKFFYTMDMHDIVSWNALLKAHLLHRQGDEVVVVWKRIEDTGIFPNEISFLLTISACKYTKINSVNFCRSIFASMINSHGIKASQEHYAAFVEVLCQWDCFYEAEELITNMPISPGVIVWRSLLHSSRLRCNLSLGRQAMQHILALKPLDPSTYVLISNIYSSSGRWHCSEKVKEEMRDKGMRKLPAQSWIIHQNKLHSFYTRDRSHQQYRDIYSALDILISECMKAGYAPDTSFVLHEVEEFQKTDFLFYHSAKLAIVYGILMTAPGKPVMAMKNIHLCGDCHSFLKHVSIVTKRDIILRDSTGFHHFRCGQCTCRDYW